MYSQQIFIRGSSLVIMITKYTASDFLHPAILLDITTVAPLCIGYLQPTMSCRQHGELQWGFYSSQVVE